MHYKILAADDETELLDALELFFNKADIELIKAENGIQALKLFQETDPHLVLLDVMMPGLDGFQVLRKIREKSRVPAIMLTAKNEDYDKILGLELGADDYVGKPYNPMEVVARVKAQLRRNYDYQEGSQGQKRQEICIGTFVLCPEEGKFVKNGRQIELTKTELLLLEQMMRQPGRIFTKRQMIRYAWGEDYLADDNTLMVHISNLRGKIEDDPKNPAHIKTIKGLGYKFER